MIPRTVFVMLGLMVLSKQIVASEIIHDELYEEVFSSENIKLHIANKNDQRLIRSNIHVLVTNAQVGVIKDNILEVNALKGWFSEVSAAKLIDRESTSKQRIQLITDMPFPLADRETTMIQDVQESSVDYVRISLSANYDGLAENDRYVRIDQYSGEWLLTQKGADVLVEFNAVYDPKVASIPQPMVVNNLKSAALDFVRNLSAASF